MSASPQTISIAQFVPGQTGPKLIKTPVEGALHLAVLGVPVVPLLIRSKKCTLPGWENKSTTNITQINVWEAEMPGRNYGVVAYARPGGIWILEVDSPDVLKRLSEETGKILPKTMRVRSSVGRGHIYWRHTPASIAMGNLQQSAVEHGDFSARCDAMYVVAPGGVHAVHGTQYELLSNGTPVAEAPDWLIEWLIKQKKSGTSATTTSELPKIIPAGQRNSMLASIAGSLRQAGLEQDQILEHLLKMNQERCEPPLAESEIRTIAGSISKYPNGIDERVAQIPLINGRPAGSTPVNERKIEIDTSELGPRPEFPRWIVEGTSLYEGLAKPVSDVNSKYPEMIWLPAVQLMLNYLDRRIYIEGMLLEHVPSLVERGGSRRSALYATCCCGVECGFSFPASSFSSR
jgi:Bifunctional DNA primase/polymerase, N-terminal/Primase C terminal 1 (PriCT-1)